MQTRITPEERYSIVNRERHFYIEGRGEIAAMGHTPAPYSGINLEVALISILGCERAENVSLATRASLRKSVHRAIAGAVSW